jgi:hypothetical protein
MSSNNLSEKEDLPIANQPLRSDLEKGSASIPSMPTLAL